MDFVPQIAPKVKQSFYIMAAFSVDKIVDGCSICDGFCGLAQK
jgi:hypothetical protein